MTDLSSYTRHEIDADDIEAAIGALMSGYLTGGPMVERFEAALADRHGAHHAVACSNGTAALWLAMMTAGYALGDTITVPAITFVATASVPRLLGVSVDVVDVHAGTGLAAMPPSISVHLGGQRSYGGCIEDAAHAVGHEGLLSGGVMACLSFHAAKQMTTAGEGGAVLTNNPDVADNLRRLRDHGLTRDGDCYEFGAPSLNLRMTELQAAMGVSQLRKLDGWIARRRELAAIYDELLAGAQGIQLVPHSAASVRHLYQVLVPADQRDGIRRRLKSKGIGTQIHYKPIPGGEDLPGAKAFSSRCLTLPLFPAMTDDDPGRVVEALKEAVN